MEAKNGRNRSNGQAGSAGNRGSHNCHPVYGVQGGREETTPPTGGLRKLEIRPGREQGKVWRSQRELVYWQSCCSALFAETPTHRSAPDPAQEIATKSALRPGSSVVERGPEKAGVGGSIPSLATT